MKKLQKAETREMQVRGKKKVLFVCTGNVCRSPMAEYLLRSMLDEDMAWEVESAGVSAVDGLSASSGAFAALGERGINPSGHRSRSVDRELIDSASVIVVMTASHRERLESQYPEAREKIFLLRSFDAAADARDIDDPIGLSDDAYRIICDQIEHALPGLIDFLRHLQNNTG